MIPIERLLRLLENVIGADHLRTDPGAFRFGIENGFSFTPSLDAEDIATLARIASGEGYEQVITDG